MGDGHEMTKRPQPRNRTKNKPKMDRQEKSVSLVAEEGEECIGMDGILG